MSDHYVHLRFEESEVEELLRIILPLHIMEKFLRARGHIKAQKLLESPSWRGSTVLSLDSLEIE